MITVLGWFHPSRSPELGQIVLYKRLGRVWAEKLERERQALDAWLCADELDRNDLETLGALSHLYRA
ncbi:MAG: hypothetical protein IH802_10700, partial [Nitrospinae bacterium]|nr:hypothetical protein [Nitrospinota bacterium]